MRRTALACLFRDAIDDLTIVAVERLADAVDIQSPVVPIKHGHVHEFSHAAAIGACRHCSRCEGGLLAKSTVAGADNRTRHEPLKVPIPRPNSRLVEVVEVEDERALGGCVEAEVAQVRIAACDDLDARVRSGGEVCRHDGGRSTVEGEWACRHALHSEFDKLRQASGVLGDEYS